MLFFAGHGVNDPRRGYHFLPHDGDLEKLRSTLISGCEVRDVLNTLTGKVLVFLDTCRSGSLFGDTKTRDPGDVTGFVDGSPPPRTASSSSPPRPGSSSPRNRRNGRTAR